MVNFTNKGPGGQLGSYALRKEESSCFVTGDEANMLNYALQSNSETDRKLNSHFTSCCQRPLCELWVRKNLQQREEKTKTTKDPPLLVTLAWNCQNRHGVEQDRWSPEKQTGMIPQTHPDTTPKPDPPTAPTKSGKLPRCGSLRSNQVAFHQLTILCCWIVKWRVWRVEERAVWPKHTMVARPGEQVATRFERCQKAAS